MKKLLFLLMFIPLISISQEISDNEEPSFEGVTMQTIIKEFNANKKRIIDGGGNTDFIEITRSTDTEFKYRYNIRNGARDFEFYFNSKGELIAEHDIQWTSRSRWDQVFLERKTAFYEYDSNPKQIDKNIQKKTRFSNRKLTILKPLVYNVLKRGIPTDARIGKLLQRRYKGRKLDKVDYEWYAVITSFLPQKNSKKPESKTDYFDYDLKDDDMKYNLKNYINAFLFDVTVPNIFLLRDYNNDVFKYFETSHSKLNEKDLEYLKSFHFNDEKVFVEYKNLDDEMLAYAVGNVFENEEIRIVVDPIKMAQASPSKRAYIMYHELFHTLGLIHGECGPMMFPYVEKEYTWDDFKEGKLKAHECFVIKRNRLHRSSN